MVCLSEDEVREIAVRKRGSDAMSKVAMWQYVMEKYNGLATAMSNLSIGADFFIGAHV